MNNRILIMLTGLSAAIFLIGQVSLYLFKSFHEAHLFAKMGTLCLQVFAIILLLKNGTLINKVYFKILIAFLFIILVAFIFKIMHWPNVKLIFSAGTIGVVSVYLYHFIKKTVRKRLDIIKLIWVLLIFPIYYFGITLHTFKALSLIPVLVLFAAYVEFLVKHKNQT